MSTDTIRRRGLCRSGANVKGYAYRSPDAEVRAAAGDDGTVTIEGYAVVWNRYSADLGGYVEQIDPAAFDDSLGSDDQIASYNHDYAAILGRRSTGTLELTKDNIGLRYTIAGDASDPDVVSRPRCEPSRWPAPASPSGRCPVESPGAPPRTTTRWSP